MTTALATVTAASVGSLPAGVQRLLEARLPGATGDVRWHAQSGTRLDTGRWLARAPLHMLVCRDRLVLIATGPRPYVLEVPVAVLSDAIYNHVTGELSFPQSAAGPAVPAARLDPFLARSLQALAPPPTPPKPLPGISSHA